MMKQRNTATEVGVSETPMISIVDDDESVREAIKGLIRSMGYRAEVFASAEEFLSSGDLNETACLILDVRMAEMSGLELQTQLTASGCRVPIIFISAHSDSKARARALEAGAVAFLMKPFSDDALLNAINSSLSINGADAGGFDPDQTT
jgi:FixJ family two-component response regulator